MDIIKLNLNAAEPSAPTESEARFQIAFLAAVAGTAVSLVARFAFNVPLVPEILAQAFFAVSPIWLVELAVGLLGPFAKHLAFLSCLVLYLAALTAAAIASLRYVEPFLTNRLSGSRWFPGFLLGLSCWAVTVGLLLPAVGKGFFGGYLRQGAVFSSSTLLVVYLLYGAALSLVSLLYFEKPGLSKSNVDRLNRRRLVRGVGYSVLAIGLYDIGRSLLDMWFQSSSGRVNDGNGVFPNMNGLAREITPVPDFYVVSKNAFDPQVNGDKWRLEIAGMVDRPLSLTYAEVRALPHVEQYATLECISNEVGGNLIGNALWRGVRLKDLIEKAGLRPGVVDIVLRASDDYSDSIPLDRAMGEGTILVYDMNGQPLSPIHGYPLRVIVPGIYGMKNVKWITRIEAVDYDLKGYWQRRGWDDRAEYKTMSRIDVPTGDVKTDTEIAGVAFAGDRGIGKVEISVDGGSSWDAAEIKPALSPFTWVLWHKLWKPDRKGRYSLVVRATDGRGNTQTSQPAPPAPDGSSGYDRRRIDAE
jgi:DMSO/TMAO reductase YedYZ molybdopterin-dependent catalytic subunit